MIEANLDRCVIDQGGHLSIDTQPQMAIPEL
jgi:hypothetical protein